MPSNRADLEARIAAYKKAELAILNGAQRYEVEDKEVQRGDLKVIRDTIKQLQDELDSLPDDKVNGRTRKYTRTQRVLPKRY
jgi:N-methylhydantoinase B/oxoprolinase/acetone carboxylase alpha subunit